MHSLGSPGLMDRGVKSENAQPLHLLPTSQKVSNLLIFIGNYAEFGEFGVDQIKNDCIKLN